MSKGSISDADFTAGPRQRQFHELRTSKLKSPLPYKTEKDVHLASPELHKGAEPRLLEFFS